MLPATLPAEELTLNTGLDFSTGDYGLLRSTEIITIPLSVSYTVNRTTWDLSLPYLHINGPGGVVPGIGRNSRRQVQLKSVNQGLGDLTLGVTQAFAPTADQPWSWAAGAEIKIGTASAEKFLGTGEDDFATHVDLSYSAGSFTPFVTVGYRWLGNPPGSDLRNYFFGTIGVSWTCPEQSTVSVLVDLAEKNSDSGDSALNFMISASRSLGEKWLGQIYGVVGTSDASPDYGLGLSVGRRF